MRVVANCSMKGGVGKTAAAVNLSYLASAEGRRVLLWDLDPQAASTFAFRVQPRVAGFDMESFEQGDALVEAIKQTDHRGLDILPADFAYRKMDRHLARLGNPGRIMEDLFDRIGRDYDLVFLDCPPGFSSLTEGVIAAADVVLVPTIPTVLSLRALARMIKWAGHTEARSDMAAFFSMVDRRKVLHRRACEWAAASPALFMSGRIPYASMVEQMAVRRTPLAAFASRDAATVAYADVWAELDVRVQRRDDLGALAGDHWVLMQRAIESLIGRVEHFEEPETGTEVLDEGKVPALPLPVADPNGDSDAGFVHRFDTTGRTLEQAGHALELREQFGRFTMVVGPARVRRSGNGGGTDRRAEAQIDAAWARHILAGTMSPLAALERRSGQAATALLRDMRGLVVGQRLGRIESCRMEAVVDANPAAVEILSVP